MKFLKPLEKLAISAAIVMTTACNTCSDVSYLLNLAKPFQEKADRAQQLGIWTLKIEKDKGREYVECEIDNFEKKTGYEITLLGETTQSMTYRIVIYPQKSSSN